MNEIGQVVHSVIHEHLMIQNLEVCRDDKKKTRIRGCPYMMPAFRGGRVLTIYSENPPCQCTPLK